MHASERIKNWADHSTTLPKVFLPLTIACYGWSSHVDERPAYRTGMEQT